MITVILGCDGVVVQLGGGGQIETLSRSHGNGGHSLPGGLIFHGDGRRRRDDPDIPGAGGVAAGGSNGGRGVLGPGGKDAALVNGTAGGAVGYQLRQGGGGVAAVGGLDGHSQTASGQNHAVPGVQMQIDGLSGGLGVLDQENKVGAAAQLSIRGFIDGGHGSAARILGHIGGGAAAVQVQRRDAAQFHHALGQLRQGDAGGIAALGTVHGVEDQSAVCLNAHSGTGRPLIGGVEHKAGHSLSILNQGLVAA